VELPFSTSEGNISSDYEISRKIKPVKGLRDGIQSQKCGIILRVYPLFSWILCSKLTPLLVSDHLVTGNAYLGDLQFGLLPQSFLLKFFNCLFKGKI